MIALRLLSFAGWCHSEVTGLEVLQSCSIKACDEGFLLLVIGVPDSHRVLLRRVLDPVAVHVEIFLVSLGVVPDFKSLDHGLGRLKPVFHRPMENGHIPFPPLRTGDTSQAVHGIFLPRPPVRFFIGDLAPMVGLRCTNAGKRYHVVKLFCFVVWVVGF